MKYMRISLISMALIFLYTLHASKADAFNLDLSHNKIFIGKDSIKNGDVYLHKFSIIKINNKIKRAVHSIVVDKFFDKHTEEYTADYNCLDRTLKLIKVSVINDGDKGEANNIAINIKVANDTIESNLLDFVCSYKNSKLSPKRKL